MRFIASYSSITIDVSLQSCHQWTQTCFCAGPSLGDMWASFRFLPFLSAIWSRQMRRTERLLCWFLKQLLVARGPQHVSPSGTKQALLFLPWRRFCAFSSVKQFSTYYIAFSPAAHFPLEAMRRTEPFSFVHVDARLALQMTHWTVLQRTNIPKHFE